MVVQRRRISPANTASRRKAETVSVETGRGFVSASVTAQGKDTYYETDREVTVLERRFTDTDPPAHVRVSGGLTKNLGNYESLRVDCSVTIPCHRSEIEEAYLIGSDFVADKINEEIANWVGVDENKQRGKGR